MLDLLDIFAPAAEAPPTASAWAVSGTAGQAQAVSPLRSDPWDTLGNGHLYLKLQCI